MSVDDRRRERNGLLLGLLGMALFSLTLPATRIAVRELDPVIVGFGRAIVAAAVAAMLLLATGQGLPRRPVLFRLVVVGLGIVVGFPLFSAIAMQWVPAAHGGVMIGILPLATACAGVVIAREKPSLGFWISALAGSGAVVGFALSKGGGALHAADLLLLLAVISAAVGYALGGELAKTLGGWQVICWSLIVSVPFVTPPVLWRLGDIDTGASGETWLAFLYVALVSQLLAFFAWYKGLAMGGVSRVGQTQLLQPFLTILFAALLLGEAIDLTTAGFAGFVVATVAVNRRTRIERG